MLDTCVLSELVKSTPDAHVVEWFKARQAHELCISAMTLGELQRGVNKLAPSKRRSALASWLEKLESGFEDRVLAYDGKVGKIWAQMTVDAEALGKSMAAFDSIIAATALAHGCKLVTRNVRDFTSAGVETIDPWR
jgi:predicted nucleic acid-binding protein